MASSFLKRTVGLGDFGSKAGIDSCLMLRNSEGEDAEGRLGPRNRKWGLLGFYIFLSSCVTFCVSYGIS